MKLVFQFVSVVLTPLLAASPMWSQSPAPVGSGEIQLRIVDSDGKEASAGSHSAKGFTIQVSDKDGAAVPDAAIVLRLPEEGPTGSFADGTHSLVGYSDQNGRVQLTGINWGVTPGTVAIKLTATKGDVHAGMLLEEKLTGAASPILVNTAAIPEQARQEKPVSVASAPAPTASIEPHVSVRQPGTMPDKTRVPEPAAAARTGSIEPTVSVVNGQTHEKLHSGGHKKWVIIAAVVAAGAGAGLAMGGKGKSTSSSTATGVSVGGPSVSIGKP